MADEHMRSSLDSDNQALSHHSENHFTASNIVRNIIMGVSDRLTVPFVLAAGLSGANASSYIVLTAGIAEAAAGAISMGLGGFELGLEKPDPRRAMRSAITIAVKSMTGGLVPLLPYMLMERAREALLSSVALTLLALLLFGYPIAFFIADKPLNSAFQTVLIGAIASASASAFSLAKLVHPLK